MRKNNTPSIDDLLAAFQSLSASDKTLFNQRAKRPRPENQRAKGLRPEKPILAKPVDPLLSLDDVAFEIEKDKSQVSRLIANGKLLSHGERGTRQLKVYVSSVRLFMAERLKHDHSQLRTTFTPKQEKAYLKGLEAIETYILRIKQLQIDAGTVNPAI